jgi:asparagine synthase (glutamine-hydrolysing)
MKYSIESRVPLLDHRLVEFCFTLPNEYKINNSETKYILRKSLENILPEKVTARRDKKGFVTPGEVHWLRNSMKNLLEVDYNNLGFLNKEKTNQMLKDFNNGSNRYSNIVWRLAMLNKWMKNL